MHYPTTTTCQQHTYIYSILVIHVLDKPFSGFELKQLECLHNNNYKIEIIRLLKEYSLFLLYLFLNDIITVIYNTIAKWERSFKR